MRLRFPVIQGQVEVEYVELIHRSRRSVVIEIGTRQKYAEVIGYGGDEMHLAASEDTRSDSYDPLMPVTTIMFPARYHGWDVIPDFRGRYSLRVGIYRLGRRNRHNLMEEHTDAWRIRKIKEGTP